MLAYILALVVGLGSLALYVAAFFFPEVHRKNDFILSGLGMFYALVLWVCAGRITGGLLLGQIAGVVVLGWLGWETLNLRRGMAPADQQIAVPSAAAVQAALANLIKPETLAGMPTQIGGGVRKFVGRFQSAIAAGAQAKQAASAPVATYVPLKREDFAEAAKVVPSAAADVVDAVAATAATSGPTIEETLAEAMQAVEAVPGPEVASLPVVDLPPPSAPEATPVASPGPRPEARPVAPKKVPTTSVPDLPGKVIGAIAGIAASIPTVFQKLTKKKESQPIYVRKQFRPDDADPAADLTGPTAVTSAAAAVAAVAAEPVVEPAVEPVVEPVVEPAVELAGEPAIAPGGASAIAEAAEPLTAEPLTAEPLTAEPLTAEPSADDGTKTLTDVVLADLARDLFQEVPPDPESTVVTEIMPASLTVESARTESLATEAETAAMDLYGSTDGPVPEPNGADVTETATLNAFADAHETVDGESVEPARETLESAGEFDDQWSGAQGAALEDLPIDPPFIDE